MGATKSRAEKMPTAAGKLVLASRFAQNDLTDTSSASNTNAPTSSPAFPEETKKKNDGADNTDDQFDATFTRNLRRAFN